MRHQKHPIKILFVTLMLFVLILPACFAEPKIINVNILNGRGEIIFEDGTKKNFFFDPQILIDDIYIVNDFKFNYQIRIKKGIAVLGHIKTGFVEAIIFPLSNERMQLDSHLKGKIEHLYLRFDPEMFDCLFKGKLQSYNLGSRQAIYNQAFFLHKSYFRCCNGRFANCVYPGQNVYEAIIKIKGQTILVFAERERVQPFVLDDYSFINQLDKSYIAYLNKDLEASRIHHSADNVFMISNFDYHNEFKFKKGIVVLGKFEKGFIEAVLFPLSRIDFSIPKIKGETEYFYLMFKPEQFRELFPESLVMYQTEDTRNYISRAVIASQVLPSFFKRKSKTILNDYDVIVKLKDSETYLVKTNQMVFLPLNPNGGIDVASIFNRYHDGIFDIYYPENSIIKDKIPEWLAKRKQAFEKTCKFLGVDWHYGTINFYVFNDNQQGQDYYYKLGFASSDKNEIYTRHNQCIIETYNLLNDGFYDCRHGYKVGASFVEHLIKTYGLELFKEFYSQNDFNEKDSFKHYYKKEYEELLEEWKTYLKDYQVK